MILKTFLNPKIYLAFIVAFALILRVYHLSQIPPVITPDEASMTYNAFSLAQTGRDERGNPWPLIFSSFGDFKSPGTHYLLIPFVNFFGLNLPQLRLITAISGSLSVFAIYLLAKQLFKDEKPALISSFLLAISPWHINASRMIFEPMNALWLSLLTLTFLLKSRQNKRLFVVTFFFLILASLTYTIDMLLFPFFLTMTLIIFKKAFFKTKKHSFLIFSSFIIFIVLTLGLSNQFFSQKSSQSLLSHQQTINTINQRIHILKTQEFPNLFIRSVINKPAVIGYKIVQNYTNILSPKFLFFGRATDAVEDIGHLEFGNLLIFLLPLIILGLIKIIKDNTKASTWIFWYAAIAIIVNGISFDGLVTHRLFHFLVAIILISSQGVLFLFKLSLKSIYSKLILTTLIIFAVFNLSQYLVYYYLIYPQSPHPQQEVAIDQAIATLAQRIDELEYIYITPEIFQSYAYFAFYLQFDPLDFQNKAERIQVPNDMDQVIAYDNFRFRGFPNYTQRCQDYQLKSNQKIALLNRYNDRPELGEIETVLIPHPNPNEINPKWKISIISGKQLNQDLIKAKIPCRVN